MLPPRLLTACSALHLAGRRLPEASLLSPVQSCSSSFEAAGSSPEGAVAPADRQSRFRGPCGLAKPVPRLLLEKREGACLRFFCPRTRQPRSGWACEKGGNRDQGRALFEPQASLREPPISALFTWLPEGPQTAGRLSFGSFSLAKQRKGTCCRATPGQQHSKISCE